MVLNIVSKLSSTFSSSNTNANFNKKVNDNTLIEFGTRVDKKFRQKNNSSICKQDGTVLRKLWNRTSSETSTRISSSDEQPLLASFEDDNNKILTKSLMKKSIDIKKKIYGKKQNVEMKAREVGYIDKKASNKDFEVEQRENSIYIEHQYISPFNYKSYPLSNTQIANWMNKTWSEQELENDKDDLVMMEIDAGEYKNTNKANKRIITPFHSLTVPKISIGEYFTTRIVKFVCLTSVDFCVMTILIRRAVEKSNGILKVTCLTAHRLVLAAALLCYKLMYDVQYGIKFWAHIGGVPQWEMVMLEYHLLKILDWDLNITPQEFKMTYLEILSDRDSYEQIMIKQQNGFAEVNDKEVQNSVKDNLPMNSNKVKHAKLYINVSGYNSNRKK